MHTKITTARYPSNAALLGAVLVWGLAVVTGFVIAQQRGAVDAGRAAGYFLATGVLLPLLAWHSPEREKWFFGASLVLFAVTGLYL